MQRVPSGHIWNALAASTRQAGVRSEIVDALRECRELPGLAVDEAAVADYGRESFSTHRVTRGPSRRRLDSMGPSIETWAMVDLPAIVPQVSAGAELPVAASRRPHVMVVGHSVSEHVFGAERSLLDVLAAVDSRRYRLSCVLPRSNDAYVQAVAKHTDNVTVFPYEWWSRTRASDPETVARFETLFRRERVDLVHVNTITLMDPLRGARNLDLPCIVHARELIDRDDHLTRDFGGDESAIVRTVREAADFIIANSDATHRLYGRDGRSFRLYNRVDAGHFDLPNALEPGTLKIGIISNNQPKKGTEDFVNLAMLASRRRPEFEFLVFGPRTAYVDRLDEVVRGQPVPVMLRFLDYVADPVDAIAQVNVVVSFSSVAESFGRTVAEAMAARRPVIAYDWGAAPELIRHGRDGFLIPYRCFAQALDHLEALADDPARVGDMGGSGRARAEQMFSPREFAANLNSIYRQILQLWAVSERRPAPQEPKHR